MRSFTFTRLLEESVSVLDLARRLGAVSLTHDGELKADLTDELLGTLARALTDRVAASDPAVWTAVVERPDALGRSLGPSWPRSSIRPTSTTHWTAWRCCVASAGACFPTST